MRKPIVFLFSCLALAGCATPEVAPPAAVADAGPAAVQNCWREAQVGTNIPRTICDTVHTEAERTREINDVWYRLNRQSAMTPAVGDPGYKGAH